MFKRMLFVPWANRDLNSSRKIPVFSPSVIFPFRSTIATFPTRRTFAVNAIIGIPLFNYLERFILSHVLSFSGRKIFITREVLSVRERLHILLFYDIDQLTELHLSFDTYTF